MTQKRITFGVSETGHRVGEAHHRARLSDAEVDQIRTLHEEGKMGYKKLAKEFGVSRATIQSICNFGRRNTTPVAYRTEKTAQAAFAVRPGWANPVGFPATWSPSTSVDDDEMWWAGDA